MELPVRPPLQPMLAKLARELPLGDYAYEPKWDGFRCIAFRDGNEVDLRSRHDRPLARYFPEVVDALTALPEAALVLDGEILLSGSGATPGLDFEALMLRLHPAASRVAQLSQQRPAAFVAFDLLALGADDLRHEPFRERRAVLERVLAGAPSLVRLTPSTRDPQRAGRWLESFAGGGVDGVVAKDLDGVYTPGRRAMVKVKQERTADCVVAGFRYVVEADEPLVSSLILALYDEQDRLRHVGVVAQFPVSTRRDLVATLSRHRVPLTEHPWRHGFIVGRSPLGRLKGSAGRWTPDLPLDWVPLRPELVAEVGFDQVDVDRFRHPARFRRWRPDRAADSCRLDQIEVDPVDLADILAAS